MKAAIKAVLAGFFGVRGRKGAESAKLKPGTVIATALIVALVMILLILLLVRVLVSSQGGGG
ncbi:DUF2970 domain-containing protein [Jeongeupia naejangsanensis]|uniref:DUF2970 domain-containing protein n=1 Tax=Jeongeupia naejangsanensis TaxID=613195 RepID=A0ABS2BQ87_9NEIS|nr:DUF2970 domain-containing protein [Jeongeupia naejangsanensis]MBM3117791.1 DUF2970 domain-containing protein [Jeongeupia naejangsanensis]